MQHGIDSNTDMYFKSINMYMLHFIFVIFSLISAFKMLDLPSAILFKCVVLRPTLRDIWLKSSQDAGVKCFVMNIYLSQEAWSTELRGHSMLWSAPPRALLSVRFCSCELFIQLRRWPQQTSFQNTFCYCIIHCYNYFMCDERQHFLNQRLM